VSRTSPRGGAARAGGALWARLRGWLPWLVAAAILGGLVARLPRAQLARALAGGPSLAVAVCAVAVAAAALLADAWATRAAFAVTGVRCPWGGVLLARGATYLLGLLNFAVGQSGMGIYLHRAGVGPLRTVGTLLFLFATQLGALAAVTAAGLLLEAGGDAAGSLVESLVRSLPLLAALAAAFALYLAVLAWRPAWLVRREVLGPAFAAGASGFVRASAARLPQALLMVGGLWLGGRLWGLSLPFGHGLVVLSAAVLISALPLAPSGLGTLELALVDLTSRYAPGAGAGAQRAGVLAFSLVYHLFGIATQALLGLLCLALATRQADAARRRGGGGTAAAECVVAPLSGAGQAGLAGSAGARSAPPAG
jgi:hypothetical protein